ncbi:uncharacterized protein L199_002313 [Kwoniella botswanensis]|uniref:uncharacterized protein n=1 Tax=Kwoniella botswanensis TaxID=1268659 RepID=UPI00315C5D72
MSSKSDDNAKSSMSSEQTSKPATQESASTATSTTAGSSSNESSRCQPAPKSSSSGCDHQSRLDDAYGEQWADEVGAGEPTLVVPLVYMHH